MLAFISRADVMTTDQQIGQLYELMQAIEKQSHEDDGSDGNDKL